MYGSINHCIKFVHDSSSQVRPLSCQSRKSCSGSENLCSCFSSSFVQGRLCKFHQIPWKSDVLNREILASVLYIDKSGLGSNLKTEGKHNYRKWTKIRFGITSFSLHYLHSRLTPTIPTRPSCELASLCHLRHSWCPPEVCPQGRRKGKGNGMTSDDLNRNIRDFSDIDQIYPDLYTCILSLLHIHIIHLHLHQKLGFSHQIHQPRAPLAVDSPLLVDVEVAPGPNTRHVETTALQRHVDERRPSSTFILESKATSNTSWNDLERKPCRLAGAGEEYSSLEI